MVARHSFTRAGRIRRQCCARAAHYSPRPPTVDASPGRTPRSVPALHCLCSRPRVTVGCRCRRSASQPRINSEIFGFIYGVTGHFQRREIRRCCNEPCVPEAAGPSRSSDHADESVKPRGASVTADQPQVPPLLRPPLSLPQRSHRFSPAGACRRQPISAHAASRKGASGSLPAGLSPPPGSIHAGSSSSAKRSRGPSLIACPQ